MGYCGSWSGQHRHLAALIAIGFAAEVREVCVWLACSQGWQCKHSSDRHGNVPVSNV